ncbi:MAG: hypothetical protein U1F43_26340 [Myxococcota bacterium]
MNLSGRIREETYNELYDKSNAALVATEGELAGLLARQQRLIKPDDVMDQLKRWAWNPH